MLAGLRTPDRGVLFVITGPSGVGKSTLIRQARATVPGIGFSVSATTRAPRQGEVHGEDYFFLSPEAFEQRVVAGDFLEHAVVYDRRYGTLRAQVEKVLSTGDSVLLDIDLLGSRQVRASMPHAVHVALVPPDVPTLEARLRARQTDSEQVIQGRMKQVAFQLAGVGEFDYIVVNDVLDTAHVAFQAVLLAELQRRTRHDSLVQAIERQTT